MQLTTELDRTVRDVIAAALHARPELQVYAYGFYGDGDVPGELRFLDGLEHVRRLSLNVGGLRSISGLGRFLLLEELNLVAGLHRLDLHALRAPHRLRRLSLSGPVTGLDVIAQALALQEVHAAASTGLLAAIEGLPALARVLLTGGTYRDLSALARLPALDQLEVWQLRGLDAADLGALAGTRLRALSLGALRNVTQLDAIADLAPTLRHLTLEKVPSLTTYQPLADLRGLTAFGAWGARPADRTLRPLHGLPLRDVSIADVYPVGERRALLAALPETRVSLRGVSPGEASQLRWRSLQAYTHDHPD